MKQKNPNYEATFVFQNDFPSLNPTNPAPASGGDDNPLFRMAGARGNCRVMCFHPYSNVVRCCPPFSDAKEKSKIK